MCLIRDNAMEKWQRAFLNQLNFFFHWSDDPCRAKKRVHFKGSTAIRLIISFHITRPIPPLAALFSCRKQRKEALYNLQICDMELAQGWWLSSLLHLAELGVWMAAKHLCCHMAGRAVNHILPLPRSTPRTQKYSVFFTTPHSWTEKWGNKGKVNIGCWCIY